MFRVKEITAEGIVIVAINTPGSSQNVLSLEGIASLDRLCDALEATANPIKGILLVSGKPGKWIAGADVKEFANVDQSSVGREISRRGQHAFARLAALAGGNTAALIEGPALGGGAEILLRIGARLGVKGMKGKIGFPESDLGILPGFGGTVCLPRLIGLEKALMMILKGNKGLVSLKEAKELGLIDEILTPDESHQDKVIQDAVAYVEKMIVGEIVPRGLFPTDQIPDINHSDDIFKSGHQWIYKNVKGEALQGHYQRIIWVMRQSLGDGVTLDQSLEIEAQALGDLVATNVSRGCVKTFFLGTRLSKPPREVTERDTTMKKPSKIGVLGGGFMGLRIATRAAKSGLPVILWDYSQEAVEKARAGFEKIITGYNEKMILKPGEEALIRSNLTFTVFLLDLKSVDFIIEAVSESVEIKHRVIGALAETINPKGVILASNSSGIGPSILSLVWPHPENVVGLHFFSPADVMPGLEVIMGENTSIETAATAWWVGGALRKSGIFVRKDTHGFFVNRVLTPYLMGALNLIQNGASIESIDVAMTEFGMPVGPIRLLDEVGMDVVLAMCEDMEKAFGDRFVVSPILKNTVAQGRIGRKSQFGFYLYTEGQRGVDTSAYNIISDRGTEQPDGETIVKLLIGALARETAMCLKEELIDDLDTALWGLLTCIGFPAHRLVDLTKMVEE